MDSVASIPSGDPVLPELLRAAKKILFMTVAEGQGKEKRKEGIPSRHSGDSLEAADTVIGVHGWGILALALMCPLGS